MINPAGTGQSSDMADDDGKAGFTSFSPCISLGNSHMANKLRVGIISLDPSESGGGIMITGSTRNRNNTGNSIW